VFIELNYSIMKKSLKTLKFKKEVVSKLESNKVTGKGATHCCPTADAFNSCPPPGRQCF